MRRVVWGTVLATVSLLPIAMAACVGEDPSTTSTVVPDSGGGTPDTGGTGTPDTGGAPDTGVDAGGGADSAVKVQCDPPDPQLFAPGLGPFCQIGGTNHCAFGEHCCRDIVLNTSQCAASCPNNVVDVACYNTAECNPGGDFDAGGLLCCAKGTVTLGICSYAVTQNLKSTGCFPSCMTGEFQACATQGECNGKTCTPTKVLKPDGKATSTLQLAACR